MLFQYPKRDITIIIIIFAILFVLLVSLPSIVAFVRAQNVRATMGTAEVQLSPDERKAIEKEIVDIHNAIQKGGIEGETTLAQQYIKLGEAYERLGYLLKAHDAYARALKQEAKNTDATIHMAQALGAMGDHGGAHDAFEKAIEYEPVNPETYKAYADYYANVRHDIEEARGVYLKGLIATVNNKDLMRAYIAFLDSIGAESESAAYRQEISK